MSQDLAVSLREDAVGASTLRAPLRTAPADRRGRPEARPDLRVVARQQASARRAPFVVLVSILLTAGLLTLLMLNTVLAESSFQMHDLTARSVVLADQQEALERVLAVEASPARLAGRAEALGMVPGGSPAFLRLSDGRVLGVPSPAKARPVPAPSPAPGSTAAAAAPKPATARPTTKPAPKPRASAATVAR